MLLPRSKLRRRRDRSPEEDDRWGCLAVLLLRRVHRRRRVRESHSCSFLLNYHLPSSKPLRRRRTEQTQLSSWRSSSTTRSLLNGRRGGGPLPRLLRRTGKGERRLRFVFAEPFMPELRRSAMAVFRLLSATRSPWAVKGGPPHSSVGTGERTEKGESTPTMSLAERNTVLR
nr:hypothetical protein Itr_chr09CG14750 [Ipomoea trifida]